MRKKIETEDSSLNSQVQTVPNDGDDRLLTVREAAHFLHIQPGSLYHFISARKIPVIRISSRCVRFSRRALLDWIESLSHPADRGGLEQRFL
jgi:excisionase family DNA binding protein